MSGKIIKNGFRQKQKPTKKEVIDTYQNQLSQLASSISQQYSICIKKIMELEQKFRMLDGRTDICDFRSLSTLKLLESKNIFGEGEHTKMAESLKLTEFEEASAKDDEARGLVPVVDRASQIGDVITIFLQAFNPETNELIEELSMPRSKIDIGSGDLSVVEKELTGLVVGEKKEFSIKLGKEFGKFKDKNVKFFVEIIDLKQSPQSSKEDTGASKEAKEEKETSLNQGRDS